MKLKLIVITPCMFWSFPPSLIKNSAALAAVGKLGSQLERDKVHVSTFKTSCMSDGGVKILPASEKS